MASSERTSRWCSYCLLPLIISSLCLTADLLAFVTTIGDTRAYIARTGGQHCWLYSHINVYTAIIITQTVVLGLVLSAAWYFWAVRYCRLAALLAVIVLALWSLQLLVNALSCWN